MTVYAEPASQTYHGTPITKTFNVMVWFEMDRVRMDSRFYTVTMTGEQSANPAELAYTIDGNPATMQQVSELLTWAKQDGSVEKVAEEVAA